MTTKENDLRRREMGDLAYLLVCVDLKSSFITKDELQTLINCVMSETRGQKDILVQQRIEKIRPVTWRRRSGGEI